MRNGTYVADVSMFDRAEELNAVLEEVHLAHLEQVDEFGAITAWIEYAFPYQD